jgi:hypothetical protein
VLKIEEIRKLKKEAKYREVIEGAPREKLRLGVPKDDEVLSEVGWAHHQLGEYNESIDIMDILCRKYPADTEIGESAWRGLAHGLLQRDGNIGMADTLMKEIPPSLSRDNIRANMMIMAARKKIKIPAADVMVMVADAFKAVPYETVNGHVVNNCALSLHEARDQEGVKPYLPILPGLIESAIGIYYETGATKNHLAGAYYRASLIFFVAGPNWYGRAEELARASMIMWRELVKSQDGARFERNLTGAQLQLRKVQTITKAT